MQCECVIIYIFLTLIFFFFTFLSSFLTKLARGATWFHSFKKSTVKSSSFFRALASAQRTCLRPPPPQKSPLRRKLWRSRLLKSKSRDLWVELWWHFISYSNKTTKEFCQWSKRMSLASFSPATSRRQTSTVQNFWCALALRNFTRQIGILMLRRIWMSLYKRETLWV